VRGRLVQVLVKQVPDSKIFHHTDFLRAGVPFRSDYSQFA